LKKTKLGSGAISSPSQNRLTSFSSSSLRAPGAIPKTTPKTVSPNPFSSIPRKNTLLKEEETKKKLKRKQGKKSKKKQKAKLKKKKQKRKLKKKQGKKLKMKQKGKLKMKQGKKLKKFNNLKNNLLNL